MILTRSTRLIQPQGPVEPVGTWAAVSSPGVWLDGDAHPVESVSGNAILRKIGTGGLATTIASAGAYVSYGANAKMQLSSSSGVICFMVPAFSTAASLFSTNLANVTTTNAFYVAAFSAGCAIHKANAANIITTTNAPYAGRINVLAWRYNNVTGDAAIALNGVLTKATTPQTFTHGTVARGRFRLTDTVQSATHEQLLFALTPRQISDAELLALSRNPWQLFRPVQRRIYFDMGAGGGATHTVTAAPAKLGGTTTRPGLTQTHITTARPVTQSATVTRPAITQNHVVTARTVLQGATVNTPSISQGSITVVTARPVVQSSAVNAPSIVQAHVLTARTVAHGSTVTRPGLNQTHTVTARAVAQGSTVNLGEVLISLAGAASTQANTGSAVAIAQSINLQGSNAIQVNAAWAAAIVQAHHLSGAASQQANQGAAGQITLGDLPVVEEVLGTGRLRVGPADMVLASQRIGTSSLLGTGPRIGTTILSTRRPGRMTI